MPRGESGYQRTEKGSNDHPIASSSVEAALLCQLLFMIHQDAVNKTQESGFLFILVIFA